MNKEQLLIWCWKYKELGTELTTSRGLRVEVIDCGLYNPNSGPSFFNAKVRIDRTLWVGNVQIVDKASEWYLKCYDRNEKHGNVILIVCNVMDTEPIWNGTPIPVIQAEIKERYVENANTLMQKSGSNLCKAYINEYNSELIKHAWFAALQTEYLENESERIRQLFLEVGDWETVFFITLFRAFGFGINNDAMDKLARSIPMTAINRHRDDLFQIEAIVLGQAGLLERLELIPERYQKKALNEGYFAKLRNEYLYLRHKFSMTPISVTWKKYGIGRHHYPFVVLSMLANFIYMRKSFDCLLVIEEVPGFCKFLNTRCTPYWETHNLFGLESLKTTKCLSRNRQSMIIVFHLVPLLFAYGRFERNEEIIDRAFDITELIKPFVVKEAREFEKAGVRVCNAGDTIALCHMQHQYCDAHKCLKCRFGHSFIKNH